MKIIFALMLMLVASCFAQANDTLYFRMQDIFTGKKKADGRFVRKAVLTADSSWIALDYTETNILVARGYYTDTTFSNRLYCHTYYDALLGYRRLVTCYKDGKRDGMNVAFDEKGDTMYVQIYSAGNLMSTKDYPAYDVNKMFTKVQIESEFPGGKSEWNKFLAQNQRYPELAIKRTIEGTVLVQFVIDEKGKVTDVEVIQSVHRLLDREAVRLIKSSPDWTPAIQSGRPVKSWKRQPIVFKLVPPTP